MNIRIPEYYLKMPQYLPNDLEGMILTYPKKFPYIVAHYEEVSKKFYADPEGFRAYGNSQLEELKAGLEKVKSDWDNTKDKTLKFMVETDQRLNKLFCYRFWIVNYLFADGPIHSFYVDNLKRLVPLLIVEENVVEYEAKVEQIIQDLLQSDYADLYLIQALNGNYVYRELHKIKKIEKDLEKVTKLIDEAPLDNAQKINEIWKKLWEEGLCDNELIKKKLSSAIYQVKFRKSMLPLYNALTHTIEFRKGNLELFEKHENMQKRIDEIMRLAKKHLSPEDVELFEMSYKQAKNFSMYKDVMGSVDGDLLPFWFGLHDMVKQELKKINPNAQFSHSGQAAMFNSLVWYLPDDLKAVVMSPDMVDFSVETL